MSNNAYENKEAYVAPSGGGGGGGYTPIAITGLEDHANLILRNGATLTGGALVCNGASNQYGELADNTGNYDVIFGSDFAMSAKFKLTGSLVGDQTIVAKQNGAPNYEGWVLQMSGDDVQTYLNVGSSSPTNKNTFPVKLQLNVWYAVVFQLTTGQDVSVYLNGVLVGEQSAVEWPPNTTTPVLIGCQHDGTNPYNPITGEIKDVEVFQRLLTRTEIEERAVGALI